ncbi:MAG: hypothetical protein LBT20_01000 [Clostridiales bacterium]|nr:hypothetical protein [Clostridiales bacterium]
MSDKTVNAAYAKISKIIRHETNAVIENGLSKNEEGKRPIIEKAQNYLDNHYLKTLENQRRKDILCFVDMPFHYTNINKLMNIKPANEKKEE